MSARVLIVDADRDHAESLADVFGVRGHGVQVAHDGAAGLACFRQAEFDLTLLDAQLPGTGGLATFFQLRNVKPEAKILMMTGFGVEHLLAQAVENGAFGMLQQPFAMDDLLGLLRRIDPRGLILVGDSAPGFAAGCEPVLRRNGYAVEIARTGQQALDKARAGGINCLVLDLGLPLLGGLDVYHRLAEAGRAVTTILVTRMAPEDGVLERPLLIKPFDPAEALRAIDAIVRAARA